MRLKYFVDVQARFFAALHLVCLIFATGCRTQSGAAIQKQAVLKSTTLTVTNDLPFDWLSSVSHTSPIIIHPVFEPSYNDKQAILIMSQVIKEIVGITTNIAISEQFLVYLSKMSAENRDPILYNQEQIYLENSIATHYLKIDKTPPYEGNGVRRFEWLSDVANILNPKLWGGNTVGRSPIVLIPIIPLGQSAPTVQIEVNVEATKTYMEVHGLMGASIDAVQSALGVRISFVKMGVVEYQKEWKSENLSNSYRSPKDLPWEKLRIELKNYFHRTSERR
jgi:hypothetical protein